MKLDTALRALREERTHEILATSPGITGTVYIYLETTEDDPCYVIDDDTTFPLIAITPADVARKMALFTEEPIAYRATPRD